jgi:hypothetical protein
MLLECVVACGILLMATAATRGLFINVTTATSKAALYTEALYCCEQVIAQRCIAVLSGNDNPQDTVDHDRFRVKSDNRHVGNTIFITATVRDTHTNRHLVTLRRHVALPHDDISQSQSQGIFSERERSR